MYNMHMKTDGYIDFEWDDRKASANESKHGVTFDEAADAFSDPYARVIPDPDHSDLEERFVLVGMSLSARVLTVCHCERRGGSAVRIISARKSTRAEREAYWRYRDEG